MTTDELLAKLPHMIGRNGFNGISKVLEIGDVPMIVLKEVLFV